ncbi:MarR family winged helix-turn-helix transcriptional regulator [Rudanella lutea]|jgi:DNA-binding MarR family transcriptional regulator|uniref:MarR family winged helix-turn-helix transcriptional regulator n=1 Tax=Rudanella lutea TaxID=451374 RepID=UPI00036F2C41|nr:winged helix DNA-binding protein [Rudanella lutea]
MDKGEANVIELVNAWARYSADTPNADLPGFCLHYLTEHASLSTGETTEDIPDQDGLIHKQWLESMTGQIYRSPVPVQVEARLGALVGRLGKYAYFYSKKAMQPFDFRSIEEPVYLIALMQMGTPKKSELIYEMMAEFASGTDVINRLIRMGYIEEFPDEQDRRSRRLKITPEGLKTIQQAMPVMNRVGAVAYSSLTDGEKALLTQILDKLDHYHAEHFRQSRNADFDEVYDRMVGSRD